MANCECGRPVYIKKTGECNACYLRRYWAENPQKVERYKARAAERARSPEVIAARKAREAAEKTKKAEAARDRRPFEVVLLEKTEQVFTSRERHLQKRREWNAKNADKRAAYRRTYADPNKAQRNKRAADRREAETGRRSHTSSRASTPQRQERQRKWRDENRGYVNSYSAKYRRTRRVLKGPADQLERVTTRADRDLMAEMVENGTPVREVADEFGVTPQTVRYHLKRGNGTAR